MLGWEVFVYRQGTKTPENLIARWRTSVFGLEWLDQLVEDKRATGLYGSGYPNHYSVTAGVLLPIITNGLPANNSPLVVGDDYILPAGWSGDISWNREAVLTCSKDELLLVEAWDQS